MKMASRPAVPNQVVETFIILKSFLGPSSRITVLKQFQSMLGVWTE